jgi:hypothetical protein
MTATSTSPKPCRQLLTTRSRQAHMTDFVEPAAGMLLGDARLTVRRWSVVSVYPMRGVAENKGSTSRAPPQSPVGPEGGCPPPTHLGQRCGCCDLQVRLGCELGLPLGLERGSTEISRTAARCGWGRARRTGMRRRRPAHRCAPGPTGRRGRAVRSGRATRRSSTLRMPLGRYRCAAGRCRCGADVRTTIRRTARRRGWVPRVAMPTSA